MQRSQLRWLRLPAALLAAGAALVAAPTTASACGSLTKAQAFIGTVTTSFSGTVSGADGVGGTATASLERRATLQVQVMNIERGAPVLEAEASGGTVTVSDQYWDSAPDAASSVSGRQTGSGAPVVPGSAVMIAAGTSIPCEYQLFVSWGIATTESGSYPDPPDSNPGAGGTARIPATPIPDSLELTGSVKVPVYRGDPGKDQAFYGFGGDSFAQQFDLLAQCQSLIASNCAPPGQPDGTATISWDLSPVKKKCVVPKLQGDTLAKAKSVLQKAACKLGKVTSTTSFTRPAGRVISSKPAPGKLDPGAKVDLVLSASPCVVPVLAGRLGSDAASVLHAAGCALGKVTSKYSFTGVGKGKIISSAPVAGSKLTNGASVAITVSLGPAYCSVPKFLPGETLAKAKMFLSNANNYCSVGKITYQSSTAFAKGTIVTSKPKPGAKKLPAGTPVALTVSSGP